MFIFQGYNVLDDCSIHEDAAPQLNEIFGGTSCNIREKPCGKVYLSGDGFVDVMNLTCRITHVTVSIIAMKALDYFLRLWQISHFLMVSLPVG